MQIHDGYSLNLRFSISVSVSPSSCVSCKSLTDHHVLHGKHNLLQKAQLWTKASRALREETSTSVPTTAALHNVLIMYFILFQTIGGVAYLFDNFVSKICSLAFNISSETLSLVAHFTFFLPGDSCINLSLHTLKNVVRKKEKKKKNTCTEIHFSTSSYTDKVACPSILTGTFLNNSPLLGEERTNIRADIK